MNPNIRHYPFIHNSFISFIHNDFILKLFLEKISPLICNGIAHRGLHNEEYTENGLKAFENAVNNNFAFELDIHLTRDNKLIVCHDRNLKRTTGKEGIIEQLTSDQIRQEYRLHDGGVVPTFEEVLIQISLMLVLHEAYNMTISRERLHCQQKRHE